MMFAMAALIGLCFGSFANVVIYRLPQGKSVALPPSCCQKCDTRLKLRDLLPVISWLALRGKCRYCNTKISPRYPITELTCSIIFTLTAMRYGADIYLLPLWCMAFILLCIAWIDIDTMKIPNSLLIIAAIAGLCNLLLPPITLEAFIYAIFGAISGAVPLLLIDGLVRLIAKKPGFGFGDVKLMAVAGMFLGVTGVFFAFIIAFISGGIVAGYLLWAKIMKRESYLPFAPFLCLGVLVSLLV